MLPSTCMCMHVQIAHACTIVQCTCMYKLYMHVRTCMYKLYMHVRTCMYKFYMHIHACMYMHAIACRHYNEKITLTNLSKTTVLKINFKCLILSNTFSQQALKFASWLWRRSGRIRLIYRRWEQILNGQTRYTSINDNSSSDAVCGYTRTYSTDVAGLDPHKTRIETCLNRYFIRRRRT